MHTAACCFPHEYAERWLGDGRRRSTGGGGAVAIFVDHVTGNDFIRRVCRSLVTGNCLCRRDFREGRRQRGEPWIPLLSGMWWRDPNQQLSFSWVLGPRPPALRDGWGRRGLTDEVNVTWVPPQRYLPDHSDYWCMSAVQTQLFILLFILKFQLRYYALLLFGLKHSIHHHISKVESIWVLANSSNYGDVF